MDNNNDGDTYFQETLTNITFLELSNRDGQDENFFLADFFNEKISEIGHIHFAPLQNLISLTVLMKDSNQIKVYNILTPRLDFLKFIYQNSNHKVKRAIQFYSQNSLDAQQQYEENKNKKN